MKFEVIVENKMLPLPKEINCVQDLGEFEATSPNGYFVKGRKQVLEMSQKVLNRWVGEQSKVWIRCPGEEDWFIFGMLQ